ncbi:SPOR domain-containing protein [Microbulbifer halophilus]|uniref:SPOR domain-containing protein n=1 Tax=Microbulbifer halophilus TaxID=453963 RepID=A0ABW5E9R8_9GAMM|nr:SPOR domain-containing protein [Microbulbifer halophilus]MCW8125511.1 SPOR domain-containing protein [Microbulbifer halophilus]
MSRRNASRRKNNAAGKPAWVWFVLGNFVGGFVVFMVFLNGLKEDGASAPGQHETPARQAEEESDSPRFDFYTLLQENEVDVPPPKNPEPARHNTRKDEPGSRPAAAATGSGDQELVYILQAASFRDPAEAEKLRAKLTLANLEVQVEKATDSRGTWHRVLIGPYSNRSRMARARSTLAQHELMPLVLKRPAN